MEARQYHARRRLAKCKRLQEPKGQPRGKAKGRVCKMSGGEKCGKEALRLRAILALQGFVDDNARKNPDAAADDFDKVAGGQSPYGGP